MTTLLRIDSSASGNNSKSRQLATEFVEKWLQENPNGKVIVRDVDASPLPHFTNKTLNTLLAPEENRTADQKTITAMSDKLIEEIESADLVTISAPMYNFSIPSTLKSYFDYIARAGRTFKYTETGPVGLLNKNAYVFITSGSFLADTPMDHQLPYLNTFLNFIGITIKDTVISGGQAMGESGDDAFNKAKTQIADISFTV